MNVKIECTGNYHSPKWENARPGDIKIMTWQEWEQLKADDPKHFVVREVMTEKKAVKK